jgi:hypothetical protein
MMSPHESPVPASSLAAGATWLPRGEAAVHGDLLLREMLPTGDLMTPEYLPTCVFCGKQSRMERGWQACFTATGATLP